MYFLVSLVLSITIFAAVEIYFEYQHQKRMQRLELLRAQQFRSSLLLTFQKLSIKATLEEKNKNE